MGCDIHMFAEKLIDGKYQEIDVGFDEFRSYSVFGFLADVRNYSQVPPISDSRGLPDDVSEGVKFSSDDWSSDGHSHSWLSVKELLDYDYDQIIEDRRYTDETGNGGSGEKMSLRDFLGNGFFYNLNLAVENDVDRIVFWFDC